MKKVFYEDLDCIKAIEGWERAFIFFYLFISMSGCVICFIDYEFILFFVFFIFGLFNLQFYREKKAIRIYPKLNIPSFVFSRKSIKIYGKEIFWKNIKKSKIDWLGSYPRSCTFHSVWIRNYSFGTCQRLFVYTNLRKDPFVLDLGENFHTKDKKEIIDLILSSSNKFKLNAVK